MAISCLSTPGVTHLLSASRLLLGLLLLSGQVGVHSADGQLQRFLTKEVQIRSGQLMNAVHFIKSGQEEVTGYVQECSSPLTPEQREAILHLLSTVSTKQVQISFQKEADMCLVEAVWMMGVGTRVVSGEEVGVALSSWSSYTQPAQHILVGEASWLLYVLQLVRDLYAENKMNAMTTHWFWVVAAPLGGSKSVNVTKSSNWYSGLSNAVSRTSGSETFPPSVGGSQPLFAELLTSFSSVLVEGLRGLLIYPVSRTSNFSRASLASMLVGGVEALGDGSWNLRLVGRWVKRKLYLDAPLWPRPPFDLQGRTVRLSCHREADVAPLDFTPVWKRALVIDFGLIYGTDNVVIISKAPTVIMRPFLLLQIFSPAVWVSLGVMAMVTGLVLAFLDGYREKVLGLWNGHGYLRVPFAYSAASLKIFICQSSDFWPRWSGSRFISGCLMFLAVVVGSLYSGSITAFLAIPFRSTPVDSIDDLLTTSITPTTRVQASTYNFFMKQKSGVLGQIKERLRWFTSSELSQWNYVSQIADGSFAFIDTSTTVLGITSKFEKQGQSCMFYLAKTPVRMDLDAFGFSKNSPFKYQFDEIMRWLRNSGILQKIRSQYYGKSCNAVVAADGPKPLNIAQVQGAFYVLACGVTICLAVMIKEMLEHRLATLPNNATP